MPYTKKNPPDWLKSLPEGAISIGVKVFNATFAETDDEDKARQAAWGAVKEKYEKAEDGTWKAKRAQADVSLEDVQRIIWDALQEREGKEAYVNQVYGSYIVFEKDGKYFRLPYSILEGEVQLGSEPVEVERVWVEARSQQALSGVEAEDGLSMMVRMECARDPEGSTWDVTICEPGFTKNGWYLPEGALRTSGVEMFEGADVNIYELPGRGATHLNEPLFDMKSLLVKNKAGWLSDVQFAAGKGLKAVHTFVDSFKWIGKNMLDAMNKGTSIYGLSYDAPVLAKAAQMEGKKILKLVRFLTEHKDQCSVDMVTRPAAGGKFNRAIASASSGQVASMVQRAKEDVMDKKQLWDMITEKRPDLLKDKDLEKITDEEIVALARMAMEPAVPPEDGGNGGGNDNPPDPDKKDVKDELARFRCEMALDKALAKCDLPEKAQARVRAIFTEEVDGAERIRIFKSEALDKAINDEKDYLASVAGPADDGLEVVPASRITGGIGTFEKAQMAVDRAFGLTKEDVETMARMETLDHQPFFEENLGAAGFRIRSVQDLGDYDQVPAFRGIREMYGFFTGDPEVRGLFNRKQLAPELRSRMDITSSTFTYVLGNTLGRRLVKEYQEADYKEQLILSVRKRVNDFRTQEAIKVGGFPDLAVVDPETADYEEIAGITDEEVTYYVITHGNLLTITRKTIKNDDISIITRGIAKLGRSARRTHGKYVWGKYIDNDTCVDGTAVFTSGHGNLGAAALSHSTAYIAWAALAAMTEKDSGEYIGLLDGGAVLNLIGPPAIKNLITRIEKEEFYYSSNDLTTKLPNPLLGLVKGHVLSLLSADANDWLMTLPPDMTELIEMGYLDGREEPEFFVADAPASEQVFVADKIRHKIRHEYAGAPIDYVGAYKAEV